MSTSAVFAPSSTCSCAGDRLAEAKPELERGLPSLVRREPRPSRLPGEDRPEHLLAVPTGDHGRDAGRGRHLRGDDLAAHPAAPERGADADLGLEGELALGDQLRAGRSGRPRVDAFHLGQENEQPRPHEHGDLGRERVVVAERDLVGRRRVVLVHDGHRAEAEELGEGLARVHVGGAVGDVAGRQQDLSGRDALASERLLPGRLQACLPERRGGLEPGHRARALRQPEPRKPQRDRAGRDDAHRLPGSRRAAPTSRARA